MINYRSCFVIQTFRLSKLTFDVAYLRGQEVVKLYFKMLGY